ncbi:thermonuclease family protein [Luteolibacter sp. SL250]|uniref:thermonuclease family protein n=1 Tax=Luteolibacter sp. SL250 TaxID=2995170 RepID=UPI00226E5C49|nr:thermonuclease family protein [Luteolibacter sp. SL250]WAC19018.1 thermonuclease family protein [Luteolibacter sp. SL250]
MLGSLSQSPPPDDSSEETQGTAPAVQVQEDGLPPGMTRAGPGNPVELLQSASSKPARTASLTGKVIKVADGDTITVLAPNKDWVKVRLEGIDAPEKSQEFGEASRLALSALVASKIVDVFPTGKDRYGRTLGWIEVDGIDVNRRMVADGWAWQFTKYNSETKLAQLQRDAQRNRKGLWKAPNEPMPPWEFRDLGSDRVTRLVPEIPAAPPAPSRPAQSSGRSFPQPPSQAKSNPGARDYWINSNGVRHNSGCRWFGRTKSGHYGGKNEGRACGQCGG